MAIKMIFCLRRRPETTREEFQRYWLKEHADKVKRVAAQIGMIRYVQSHTFDSAMGRATARARGIGGDFDGVMEGWWESEEQARAAFLACGSDPVDYLLKDERRFIDFEGSKLFMTKEHLIF